MCSSDLKKPDFIFYPGIPYERNEFPDSNNHFNCPIVTSYSENIKNNVDAITSGEMRFLSPFLTFGNYAALESELTKLFQTEFQIPAEEIQAAVKAGWEELAAVRKDIQRKGEETLAYLEKLCRKKLFFDSFFSREKRMITQRRRPCPIYWK